MAGSKLLRSLSFFLAITLVSYITESAFTGTLTSAGLTFTLPTLSTLTQTQLVYLTAGGLSLGAAAGLAGLAVASSLLADGGGSSGSGYGAPTGYGEPSSGYSAPSSGYDAPSSGYESPSSGGGHGHSRTLEEEARSGPAAPKFHYQWQQNIANLGRRKRATTELEGVNTFLDSLSAVDKSDCGKLYLCEIAATPEPERLTEDTKTLHLLRQTYNKRLESPGRKQFDLAWQIGLKFGVDVCRKQFRKCTIRGIVSLVKYGTVSADTL